MSASQDTEITLTTGRLLGLFFGLVVVCALFFGFGYTLGHAGSKQSGSLVGQETANTPSNAGSTSKPGASGQQQAAAKPDCTASGSDCSQSQDLTFYKSVEQKQASTQLDKAEEAPTAAPAAEMKAPSGSTGFMVQVAAVSKKEDADMLMSALRQKQYPVVVTSLPSDKLFHVQVGPFADMKDAESMKAKLLSDGYNPILKR